MKYIHAILFGLTLLFGVQVCAVGSSFADSTMFQQQILPLNCVFETVNDGTGTIQYITPAACGIYVAPAATANKMSQQPFIQGTLPTQPIIHQPSSPPGLQNTPMNLRFELPWQNLLQVSLGPVGLNSTPSSGSPAASSPKASTSPIATTHTSSSKEQPFWLRAIMHFSPTPREIVVGSSVGVMTIVGLILLIV